MRGIFLDAHLGALVVAAVLTKEYKNDLTISGQTPAALTLRCDAPVPGNWWIILKN